jgi:hypothetical protein
MCNYKTFILVLIKPRICLCCKNQVDILDGPMNSDIPTECPHFLNTTCWEGLFDEGRLACPLCMINVEDWLYSCYEII